MAARCIEARIHSLKQGKQPLMEYIQDFCHLARLLRNWPECMLVHHSREGLNKKLYQNCLPRGVPHNLQA